jgi:ABC-type multidrug transport system fused ATPase/permease subunit
MNFLFISNWTNRADKFGLTYRSMFILVSLSVASTVTEIFGIGVFLPIFQFIRLEGNIDALITDSSLWQYIVNIFDYFNIKPSLAYLLVISFILFLVRQFFTYLKLVYTTVVLHRLIQVQRNRLFNKYIEADTLYHDSVPVGNLVNVISTEVNRAMTGIMSPLELLVYSLMLMFYLIVLSVLSWQMTLFAIVAFIIISYIPKVWIIQSKDTGRKLVNANSLMSEFLIGRLRSPRLVRLSGTEIAEKNEFHRLTLKQRKHIVFSSILQ